MSVISRGATAPNKVLGFYRFRLPHLIGYRRRDFCAFCVAYRKLMSPASSKLIIVTSTYICVPNTLLSTSCLKKRPTFTTCYNFYIRSSIATIFGTNVAEKVGNQMYFIFPPHLTSAFALPGETGNPETASFHLNAA